MLMSEFILEDGEICHRKNPQTSGRATAAVLGSHSCQHLVHVLKMQMTSEFVVSCVTTYVMIL